MGNMPTGASTLLRDLGLAGFVAMVGLQSGQQAVSTVMEQGLTLFMLGVLVTIIPLLIAILFGKYVLRYDNVAVFAGSLSGARSANPAFERFWTRPAIQSPPPRLQSLMRWPMCS